MSNLEIWFWTQLSVVEPLNSLRNSCGSNSAVGDSWKCFLPQILAPHDFARHWVFSRSFTCHRQLLDRLVGRRDHRASTLRHPSSRLRLQYLRFCVWQQKKNLVSNTIWLYQTARWLL